MALNIGGGDKQWPRMMHHKDTGQARLFNSEAEASAAGEGWSDEMNANGIMAIRKAAGSVAEVVERVQRVVSERTN